MTDPSVRACGCVAVGLVLCMLCLGTAHAQTLSGTVRETGGDPLPGAQVVLPDLQRGAVTDADGRYRINDLPTGRHTVAFRFVGFEPETRTVDLQADATATLDVTLTPATVEADEVVVTGEGQRAARLNEATLSVSTLDARALEAVRGQTLGETLEGLPGVTTLTTGPSIAKPVVRGLHSQRLVLLNAGVPQEGQQWGGEHAPEIDPFAPARIEVVKGAAGVEYGAGAIGGVIRVQPRELPVRSGVGGRFMANAFSNNRQGAASLLLEGGTAALPGLGWRVQSSVRKAGDAHAPDDVIGNSAFEELDANLALGYHTDQVGLDAYYSHFGTELGLFRGAHIGNADDLQRAIERGEPLVDYAFSYTIDAPKQTVQHDLVTLRGHVDTGAGDRVEVQYGFQHNQRQEFDAHRRFGEPLDRAAFDLTLRTHTLDAKWRTAPRGRFFGVAGLSGMNQANRNAAAGTLIPNFRAVTGGAFARGTWVVGPWTAEVGGRVDHRWLEAFPRGTAPGSDFVREARRYTNVSGVVGAIWQFAPAWSVATNLSTAWRPPNVNELYSFGVHHGTAQFEIGDPDLGSERSLSADLTLRHVSARAEAEVSVYANRMQDYIYLLPTGAPTVTIRGAFPTFRYAQADALLRGVDGSVQVGLTDWLTAGVLGSVLRGTDLEADVPLIYMPADRLTLSAAFRLPRWLGLHASELEVESVFVREQTRVPEGVDFAPPPPGYTLIGLGYSAEVDLGGLPVSFSLEVENLFDIAYRDYLSRFRYFVDDPGRNVVLRVQVPFGVGAD